MVVAGGGGRSGDGKQEGGRKERKCFGRRFTGDRILTKRKKAGGNFWGLLKCSTII